MKFKFKWNLIIGLIMLSFFGFSQKLSINSPNVHEHIETEKLRSFLTNGLRVDSTIKMQSAWVVIKVEKTGKVSNLYLSGKLDDKFKKILETNVYSGKVPWIKKNKSRYLWYILPVVFGQIQPNYKPEELEIAILTEENNFNSLRYFLKEYPGHVVLIRAFKSLTNKTMEENFM